MPGNKIQRLLRLVTLLQGEPPRSADELICDLGISRRTFFRDMKLLEAAGIPCYHDAATGGYRIARTFFLPPINLNVSETLGLMLLGKHAAALRETPMTGPALSAIYKLVASVPEPMRAACAEMMAQVTVDPGPGGKPADNGDTRWFNQLQQCVDEQRACRVVYKSPVEDEAQTFEIEPYGLHFVARAWYLFCRIETFDDVRSLKMQRIDDLELLERRFTRPRSFTVSKHLGNAWSLIPEGKEYKVELLFTAKVATNVAEVLWHPTQQHELLDDGRCRMRFTVDGLNEIAWWICGYADHAHVQKPKALADRVRQMHKNAAKVNTTTL